MVREQKIPVMEWMVKHKFVFRFLVVYLLHLIIKGFDATFGGFLEFTTRGITLSVYFLSFWIALWYLFDAINKRLDHLNLLNRVLLNVLFAFIAGFITDLGYRTIDVQLFHNNIVWDQQPVINPELTTGIGLFYLIGYSVSEYMKSLLFYKEGQVKFLRLEKENVMARYKSLKDQIEPHFLFNSLSVLSSLIHTNADLASEFVIRLSKTLRYIIESNKTILVPLREEMKVVEDYFFLLKTRFNESISLTVDIENDQYSEVFVPPVALQSLLENAINHNKFSVDQPLSITISAVNNFIEVRNSLNKKNIIHDSTGVGLNNIRQRYELIAGKKIIVEETEKEFIVKLPFLKKRDYENFNH
jgi:two-component system, LytTR family, sensor kinase